MGARTSQAHAQYHQLAGAEPWAAQNPQPPILSFSFCRLFPLFAISPCTEVLETWMEPSKGMSTAEFRAFGPLTQHPGNPRPGGYSGHQSLRTVSSPAPGFLPPLLKQVPGFREM